MITVQNKRQGGKGIYIGRGNKHNAGSVLGNPFKMKHEGDRDRVVEAYRVWLENHMNKEDEVKQEIHRIAAKVKAGRSVNLVCWCAPKRCHGDVIKEAVAGLLAAQRQSQVSGSSEVTEFPQLCQPVNPTVVVQNRRQRRKASNDFPQLTRPPAQLKQPQSSMNAGGRSWAQASKDSSKN